ncbi:MAG: DUF2203 family protein [Planctomycetes bacterium]|nr:DUF2203 family protein [Planctomycetota bacterium]
MNRTYTLPEANEALKLVRAIASEWLERRSLRRTLDRRRRQLEEASTPEGLRSELAELDARIWEQDEGIATCRHELEDLGMSVFRVSPLTIHIPGYSRTGPVVFCWQEGEDGSVCFGHPIGEEREQRRPLKVKTREA